MCIYFLFIKCFCSLRCCQLFLIELSANFQRTHEHRSVRDVWFITFWWQRWDCLGCSVSNNLKNGQKFIIPCELLYMLSSITFVLSYFQLYFSLFFLRLLRMVELLVWVGEQIKKGVSLSDC